MTRADVVVVGGGLNGLGAALRLARDGRRVVVVEARRAPGGLAAADEFAEGFFTAGVLPDTSTFSRDVADELGLERHGLRFRAQPAAAYHGDGAHRVLRVPARGLGPAGLDGLSSPDRSAWLERAAFLERVLPFLASVLAAPPPPLRPESLSGLLGLLGLGLRLRKLGEPDLLELARVLPMCAGDWQNEAFADPLLKAALAFPALEASFLGPWSGGTAALLLLRACLTGAGVAGGAPAIVAALTKALEETGAELLLGRRVARIVVERGAVRGVELAEGERIDAPFVLSTADPKSTLLDLIDPPQVPSSLAEAARVYRARGTTATLDLALAGPLEFAGAPAGTSVALYRTGKDLDALERAFDAAKYGRFSTPPLLEVHVPTVDTPSLAPAGRHVATILVHFAPHALRGGWDEAAKGALLEETLAELERHAPSVRGLVLHARLRTPVDLAREFGLAGGHLHHGEHAPDQLLSLRPSHECGRYATPIAGLYLGGGGSHPGGLPSGRPGLLAARALADA